MCPACENAKTRENWTFTDLPCCKARGVARIAWKHDATSIDLRKLLEHERVSFAEFKAARATDAYCQRMMKR